ncbi:HAD family hydrolase [Sphingomonas koreensis]|uniref:HAD family hydrolase n=1 Tax=Sphingomonas koreensis TaxID=93064 RepID=A0A1L6J871_9SPHN|nr:HAD family hydrolase [Sphingomonas koreensis]APR52133.1 hypothetical protein BRX40_06525 [Sphingomonas koreensis]RSU22942.1 HAD family hydrolase [Sphingomonas koreensis]RSU26807.1 HAD family hydrolase [Sphingomonas koreensis]RSU30584.1 HAD family hydrolase [Sphingomonas koreensis]RSU36949.1 HAD family hydrolase [Sphingomonas koreensis]
MTSSRPTSGVARPATIFVDADNTLWDTDAVYANAQLAILAAAEQAEDRGAGEPDRLSYVRAVDQALAARHHDGLRYPPRLLARALRHRLRGAGVEAAARSAWKGGDTAPDTGSVDADAERSFFAAISMPPALRPGVADGLTALVDAGCTILIVTEGAQAKVAKTADTLGLGGHFTRIIEGRKRPELYRRIIRLTAAPDNAFMVGDQLDRDIMPAKAAGLTTVYFPGGFRPRWTPAEDEAAPDFRIGRFDELVGIVLGNTVAAQD